MTKTELMETYTAEQLASMVINLQSASEVKNDEIHKLKWQISSLEEENGRLQSKLDTYNNYLLPRCTKEAKEMIDHNHFSGVTVVSLEQIDNRIKKESNEPDIRGYEETIDGLQSEVEKYRKAFEDAKKEHDCRIEEYRKKIEELTNENEKLKGDVGSEGYQEKQEKTNNFYGMYKFAAKDLSKENLLMFLGILTKELLKNGIDFRYEMDNEPKVWDITRKNDKTVADFLPTEPIKVADMLINASKKRTNCMTGKEYDKYIFDKWQLRQIAEHLLIYCNHNKGEEE